MKTPTPKLKPGVVYFADNGERICRDCAGQTALYTGRDRSGQRVRAATHADMVQWARLFNAVLTCEKGCTTHTQPRIHKGDTVFIRPEWRDTGDETFQWTAADDEFNGRVSISPAGTGLSITPIQTVESRSLSLVPA